MARSGGFEPLARHLRTEGSSRTSYYQREVGLSKTRRFFMRESKKAEVCAS